MKKFTCLFASIVSLTIFSTFAGSTTYYVNGLTGSNSNSPGQAKNISTPWQTVQFAINNAAVSNGDNIVIAAGNYAGFNLSKRLNIIGEWKGGMANVSTIFNSTVTMNAAGGSNTFRMYLKNLRVSVSSGNAIEVSSGFVTLENVFASSSAIPFNGLYISGIGIKDIRLESCNFNNCSRAGIYITASSDIDGFIMRNSTVNNNGYFGIAAFQSKNSPTEIKNAEFSHCVFQDNNLTNQNKGHTIYFEKLKNATFKNVSVVTPPGNTWTGAFINLSGRKDFSNINFLNTRIIRSTPGLGINIQALNSPNVQNSMIDSVLLQGVVFTNCDTNIIFNNKVKNVKVDKCDLSGYTDYGLIDFTDSGETIDASNNKWKNGDTPDTTVVSHGSLVAGSPVISDIPNTDGIFIGMGVQGFGVNPGSFVISKTAGTITMSQNATATGFVNNIIFVFNFAASTDIMRRAGNTVVCGNPLPNSIVNQDNISFSNLASAISSTVSGGKIWNLPNTLIQGNTVIDKVLVLIGPGAGFLHNGSLTTFQNLNVSSQFTMGSDFAVSENFTPGFTSISTDNTLMINGRIVSGGHLAGGERSDLFFGGTGASTTLRSISGGIRTLQISRSSGITAATRLQIRRLLFLQNGNLNIGEFDLFMLNNATIFNPFPSSSYVNTNGNGMLRKAFDPNSVSSFNFTVGSGKYSPVRACYPDFNINIKASLGVRAVNAKHPMNQCNTDYLNRYWVLKETGLEGNIADLLFNYDTTDVVGNALEIDGAKWNGSNWQTFKPLDILSKTFQVNGVSAFGEYTGGGPDCIGSFGTLINVKAFLQGAYSGIDSMRTSLLINGFVPLSQPYNTSPYNYNGTESVSVIPSEVVDWVYLELRESEAGPPVADGRRAAFIKSDGTIVDLDGISPVKTDVAEGNYFIVIGHRNHLPVMTVSLQRLDTASALYDFSTGVNKYFGNEAASLGNNQFGLFAGDANRSFIITAADYTIVTNNLFTSNYNYGDINLTGIVTAADYTLITQNIFISSNVPNYP